MIKAPPGKLIAPIKFKEDGECIVIKWCEPDDQGEGEYPILGYKLFCDGKEVFFFLSRKPNCRQ